MEKQYVLVEYHYDSRQGKEYPVTFIGTSEECQRMMLIRFGRACAECRKSSMMSGYIDTNDGSEPDRENARIQDELGSWRIEWWMTNTNECKNILPKKEGETE